MRGKYCGAFLMTDPVQALEAVLRGIEERTPHDDCCVDVLPYSGAEPLCYCRDRPARVRAEQARTVERMIREALLTGIAQTAVLDLKYPNGVPYGWDTPIIEGAWTAAFHAI